MADEINRLSKIKAWIDAFDEMHPLTEYGTGHEILGLNDKGFLTTDDVRSLLDITEAADRLSESLFLRGAAEVHRDHMALHAALYGETQRVDATEFRSIPEAE